MQEYCPIDQHKKKCVRVNFDLISTLGQKTPQTVPLSMIVNLVDISDTILYSAGNTMRGEEHTLAIDVSNSGSWLRFNVAKSDLGNFEKLIKYLDCK